MTPSPQAAPSPGDAKSLARLRLASGCALALLLAALCGGAAHAGEPSEVTSEPVEPDGGDDSDGSTVTVEPHPDKDEAPPEVPDEESGLPPNGKAERPALPYLDRDLLAPGEKTGGRGGAAVAFSKVGEDLFFDMKLELKLDFGDDEHRWRVVPRLPLRIRLVDDAPYTDDVIRTEDWDEVSDWARILAYVQYGRWGEPYVFRYGELNGVTLGHGSIVNRYYNTIDIDHYQGGLFTTLDFGFVGAEAVLDNVLDPDLLVARVFARPLSPLKHAPLPIRGLKIGVTLGADFQAPIAVDGSGGKLFAHPDRNPIILAEEPAGLFSTDIEVPLVSIPHLDLVPYADFATIDGLGFGFHLGTYVNVRFSDQIRLSTRIEYRFLGEGYEPGYVSPFYEIERNSYRGGDPKLAQLQEGQIAETPHNGFYLETDLRIERFLRFAMVYATHGGERGSDLLLRARFYNVGPFELTLFFARLGFDGLDNLWAANQTVWGTTVRVFIGEYLYARAGVTNEWWLRHTDDGGTGFETVTNFDFGGGVIIKL